MGADIRRGRRLKTYANTDRATDTLLDVYERL
jgi:predicted amidohydrolase YtcJ